MEVRSNTGEGELAEHGSRGPRGAPAGVLAARGLSLERVGALLGSWQSRELRIARSFAECRGLSTEALEDLYQETALALLARPYRDEGHLRGALRTGLKHRALNLHRDERRRGEILIHSAPSLHRIAQAREAQDGPEGAALARADRLVVSEFLTELSALEQRVFWLLAEGMRYRAIAPALGIATNEARNAARSCERKRERFQLLYDTGRLCGFRAATIEALQSGQLTSEELATRAFAHLERCPHCRAAHKTNARRLRRRFQGQAAALLPPALLTHLGSLQRLGARVRSLHDRLPLGGVPMGGGGVREGAAGALLGAGAAAKLAAGVATVAVIAGSTITASRVLERPRAKPQVAHRAHLLARAGADAAVSHATPVRDLTPLSVRVTATHAATRPASAPPAQFGPGRVVALPATRTGEPRAQAGPAGFGLPGTARATRVASVPGDHAGPASSGGPFTP